MGPIRAAFFNPRQGRSFTVPVELAPSPDTRHLGAGPVLGLRFFSHDRPFKAVRGNLTSSPVERILGESRSQSALPLRVRRFSVFYMQRDGAIDSKRRAKRSARALVSHLPPGPRGPARLE